MTNKEITPKIVSLVGPPGSGKGSTFHVELKTDFKPRLTKIQRQRLEQESKLRKLRLGKD